MDLLDSNKKNEVLKHLASLLEDHADEILEANAIDVEVCDASDKALYDRLLIKPNGIEGMIEALEMVASLPDPVGQKRFHFQHENGLEVTNKSAAFGTVLIIYESRPDVTIEAAAIAFKAGNKIRLKGGKEAKHSNAVLTRLWQEALEAQDCQRDWVKFLALDRKATQAYLKRPTEKIDLIIPRGGERLIEFVKTYAKCPVLVSGRGNNFCYVHQDADWNMAQDIINNGKLSKISACNALDKLLINRHLPELSMKLGKLLEHLKENNVKLHLSAQIQEVLPSESTGLLTRDIWEKEFLNYEMAIDLVDLPDDAISMINTFSGGHSVSIVCQDPALAKRFMDVIDAAAVYHNASTRFTDGGQFGLGAEMAISTDKLHHRGPLGLEHLVTNKWYVYGNGQTR